MHKRLSSLRKRLQTSNCDAFFSLSRPTNMFLSGFTGSTSAIVVTAREARFLCDFRYTEQAQHQVSGFSVMEVSGELEKRLGEQLKTLGVQNPGFDPADVTVYQRGVIEEAFGGPAAPLTALAAGLRLVKDDAEIEAIRAASELAESALALILEELRPGVTEREVSARLDYEFKRRGAEGAAFETIVLFGPGSSLPHGRPGEKRLAAGDIVLVDCGCIRKGYCSDLTRTFVFGRIPGVWFEEIYQVTLAAQRAALDGVAAGMRGRDVDAIARTVIADAGFGKYFGHGLGHGVGLEVHEAPRLNMESEVVLEPGMVVTVEPGIYLPGRGGVRIEDLAVVTGNGCDVLTRSSKELQVLGV